jgi:serpin B
MMTGSLDTASYASGDGWQAARLLYAGHQLAMTIIVPDQSGLAALERSLDGAGLAKIMAAVRPGSLQLTMPKWTFRLAAMLNDILAGLGMPTAFSPDADFSNMTIEEQLHISAVLHDAFIAVDEHGTEAAAATAVVMDAASGSIPVVLNADRAFMFVIHDVETATPLFIGRVDDPTA